MKRRYITLGLAVLLMLVLVAALAGPVSAKAVKTNFMTTSVANYVPPEPVVTSCGPYVYIRGNHIEASDRSIHPDGSLEPRLCGLKYLTENLNINTQTNTVVGWGTYRTVVGTFDETGNFTPSPKGGIWVGFFTEKINLDTMTGTGCGGGCGVAGNVAGLLTKWTSILDPANLVVTETGYILPR